MNLVFNVQLSRCANPSYFACQKILNQVLGLISQGESADQHLSGIVLSGVFGSDEVVCWHLCLHAIIHQRCRDLHDVLPPCQLPHSQNKLLKSSSDRAQHVSWDTILQRLVTKSVSITKRFSSTISIFSSFLLFISVSNIELLPAAHKIFFPSILIGCKYRGTLLNLNCPIT